ncbi:hypothetical protein [Halobacillus andaensis]|uniref:hypothetical protein n=1 Tax=Halobacillus andaensis TaxID=1176239 RepID=UPI003D74A6BE
MVGGLKEWKGWKRYSKFSSHRGRTREMKHFRRYFFKMKLSDITRKHYQSFLNALQEKGYTHNTLDGIHTTGRMCFRSYHKNLL